MTLFIRHVRDDLLRRSELGFDFLSHLHDDYYYGFSPEVCRLMAGSRALLEEIRDFFVGPLTACLELMVAYTLGRAASEELGRRVLSRLSQWPGLLRLTPEELDAAETVLDGSSGPTPRGVPEPTELATLIDERVHGSELVRWALFEPIRMIIAVLRLAQANATPEAIGTHLSQAFDEWAVRLPLTDVWHGLSRYAIAQELELLGRTLVRSPAARAELGVRILSHMGERPDVATLLEITWRDDEEEPS